MSHCCVTDVPRLQPAGRTGPLHCSRQWGLTGRCGQTFLRTARIDARPPTSLLPPLPHHSTIPPHTAPRLPVARTQLRAAQDRLRGTAHCAPCLRCLLAARGAGGLAAAKQLDFLLTAAAAFSPALPLGGISEISRSLRMRGTAQRRGCRATNRGREGGARTTQTG